MYSSSATSMVTSLFLKVTLCFFAIVSGGRGVGKAPALLPNFKILRRGAADGALVGGLDALELLAADGADHRDGHRRGWGLAACCLLFLVNRRGHHLTPS